MIALTFHFKVILKHPTLICSSNTAEKLWICVTNLGEVFTVCDCVLIGLICEIVWNRLHTDLLIFQNLREQFDELFYS